MTTTPTDDRHAATAADAAAEAHATGSAASGAAAAEHQPPATEAPAIEAPAIEAPAGPRVSLRVSEDEVRVFLDAEDPLVDPAGCAERIHAACEELKLPEIPDVAQLEAYLRQVARPDTDLADVPLIMGRHPSPSQDGRLAWAREFFRAGWAVDDSGAMDYWEPLERRSVSAGDELCRLIPPVAGRAGLTVFDQPIPVRKPRAEKLRAGKNVETDDLPDGTRVFRAACDGRVQYAVGTVSVDEVYVIKGDVGLETGNVYHTGSVQIQGDVKEGATIEVGGDVIVQGLVEPSRIVCGGSLNVDGGIVGDGTGSVETGGDLQALYVSEATIRADGDVVVKNEIIHSDVVCRGRVIIPEGRIAGGTVHALLEVRVREAGASGSTGTLIAAGSDPTLKERLQRLRSQLPRLEKVRARLREALQQLRQGGRELTADQRQAASVLRGKIGEIDAAIEQVGRDIEQIRAQTAAAANEEILILAEVWSGTILQLGGNGMPVRQSIHKPRRVRRAGGDVMVLPMAEEPLVDA